MALATGDADGSGDPLAAGDGRFPAGAAAGNASAAKHAQRTASETNDERIILRAFALRVAKDSRRSRG